MPEVSPYGLLHKVLRQFGYKRDPSKSHQYQQDIDIDGIIFPVCILIINPNLDELPIAYLKAIPDGLPGKLPHLIGQLALCYVDETSIYLDKYDPESNMRLVLNLVHSLLNQYVKDPEKLQAELRRELTAYWESKVYDTCYLLDDKRSEVTYTVFERKHLNADNDRTELVIGEYEQTQTWMCKRNGTKKSSGKAKIITVKDDITIPDSHWPPDTLIEFIDWLKESGDKLAANQLIDFAAVSIASNSSFTTILKLGTIYLGACTIVTKTVEASLLKEALLRNKKQGKRVRRITPEKKMSLIRRAEHHGQYTFIRVHIYDASSEYVIGRNLHGKKNLKNIRIAHIGCGTVGGYSAQMLAQSGAATGKGILDLFDYDVLRTGNLGRHALGMKYLGENKALAVAHMIKENHVSNIAVNAFPKNVSPEKLVSMSGKYDVIIDATGDYRFTTNLVHHMRRSKTKTPIIHGWVDAMGLVSRGLFDDGKKEFACHHCITGGNSSSGFDDKLFKQDVEIPVWQPEACGVGSYLAFSTHASACAAGLIQNICIDWVNGNPSPRFRHVTHDSKKVENRKSSNLKSHKKCPCCQFNNE